MKLVSLHIENYKSLRDFTFEPGDLSVVIGANGSGKSNLASSFDFLGDVYTSGLEFAIAKKGGFENVAFRRMRRTKAPIVFDVTVEIVGPEVRRILLPYLARDMRTKRSEKLIVRHVFVFKAAKQTLRTDYALVHESITLNLTGVEEGFFPADPAPIIAVEFSGGKVELESPDPEIAARLRQHLSFFVSERESDSEASVELLLKSVFPPLARSIGSISVFQFSAQIARSPGSPSPYPRLSGYGQNLPALVDWLRRNHPRRWSTVEAAMRDVVPSLEEISTEFLHSKTLGLFFKEEGFGRPWTAEDVSDGTIQALAILTALADPRNDVVMIEEPENSLHPWIVKRLAEHIKRLASRNQLVVTTHSPIVLNLVTPDQVWVIFRTNGATAVERLSNLDPELIAQWESGEERLFDLLDLGLVPQALPQGGLQ